MRKCEIWKFTLHLTAALSIDAVGFCDDRRCNRFEFAYRKNNEKWKKKAWQYYRIYLKKKLSYVTATSQGLSHYVTIYTTEAR